MTLTDEQIDPYLDAILKASGSALRHYTLEKTKDDMRRVMRAAIESAQPESKPATISEERVFEIIRGTGYVTKSDATEIAALIAAELKGEGK